MNTNENKEVMERIEYFISHYLPWLLLSLFLIGISICLYHYINKTCMFEKKDKTATPLLNDGIKIVDV